MRRLFKTGATKALIGVSIACALASPALAAKPASGRHYAHHDTDMNGTPAIGLRIEPEPWGHLYPPNPSTWWNERFRACRPPATNKASGPGDLWSNQPEPL
jgi:hypothetical protein